MGDWYDEGIKLRGYSEMGLFKKSTLMTDVMINSREYEGLSVQLFMLTDAQQKNYESISLARRNGYGERLTDIARLDLRDIVSISLEHKHGNPYIIRIVSKDKNPIWERLVVSTLPQKIDVAKDIVSNIQKVIS